MDNKMLDFIKEALDTIPEDEEKTAGSGEAILDENINTLVEDLKKIAEDLEAKDEDLSSKEEDIVEEREEESSEEDDKEQEKLAQASEETIKENLIDKILADKDLSKTIQERLAKGEKN